MPRTAAVFALASAALAFSCEAPAPESRSARIFASKVALSLYDHASEGAFEACFARLREIDAKMNMWDPASELSRLNARSGEGPIPVSGDLVATAERGLELAAETDGVFDPSVAPLVRLWGIGSDELGAGHGPRLPSEAELRAARALVGWRRVRVDRSAGTIELESRGMGLDFGALAKGYGAMEGAKVLSAMGIRSALLDVGGCVLVLGSASRGKAWRIGVQDPGLPRGSPLGYFSLRDSAVDTSGVYERYFDYGGRRYAHIFDTRTGRPIETSPIASATVALPRGRNSDGPPLALLVLGPEEGIALADSLGLAAVLLGADKRVYLSKAARGSFTLINKGFAIAN
jgi:FAD:protein FMN transferase